MQNLLINFTGIFSDLWGQMGMSQGGWQNYVMLLISVLCMSAFFSMHYLTIYYLLQPYNAGTEIKSGTYRIVVIATYLFCYGFMQLRMSTFVFGLGTIIFCVVYCAAACVLVYRLAPRTFRLRA